MHLIAIGHVETPYLTKFGVPRQSGLAPSVLAALVLDADAAPAFLARARPGCRLWVLWAFSHNARAGAGPFRATVRPPRLGGNMRVGVFASRSSFRPNPLALSCVRVKATPLRTQSTLRVELEGADMVDGTPVFALFSYEPATQCLSTACGAWAEETSWQPLVVEPVAPELLARVPERHRAGLMEVLALDPRPAYRRGKEDGRVFWLPFANVNVRFCVRERHVHVQDIEMLDDGDIAELRENGSLSRDA